MGNFFDELKRRHICRVAATHAVVAWVLAGTLVAVLALIAYEQIGSRAATSQQASTAPAGSQPADISIAVLPFVNVSADAAQEFFSDGMTDEITSALANVRSLKVIGRTSAYQYKGQNRDLRAIGQALGASHVIEGSVRRAGDRVRITAELVRSDNGVSVWSDNYDRQLTDIFAIQEDIAQAVAAALKVPLGLAQGDMLVPDRTIDPESYQQYLQALALRRSLDSNRAIAILAPLVARNPSYAPAWALLSNAYRLAATYTPVLRSGPVDAARQAMQAAAEKAEAAAQKAISLDAKLASGYSALASLRYSIGKWAEANDLYRQGMALDPNDPEILENYRFMLADAGYLGAAVRIGEQLEVLEPFAPIYNIHKAELMQLTGANESGIPILEAVPEGSDSYTRNSDLAKAYATAGRFGEAADTLLAMRTNQVSRESVEAAAGIIRGAPAPAGDPANLPSVDGSLNFVYAFVGAHARTLESHERTLDIGNTGTLYWLWDPLIAQLRKTDRFKAVIRKAGLAEYWRERGWPDLCRPLGFDDFTCD